jgi:hypothetical protein
MNWRDLLFWRRPPIEDLDGLADFVDAQSAFLVQKGLYEYARALAGHYSKVLFSEPEFIEMLERSRWMSYPVGLAMVGEMVEGTLRRRGFADPAPHCDNLRALVLSVFDRYPLPAALSEQQWSQSRAELATRLQHAGLHPPKRVIDIPEPYARQYWDLMPIHKEARSRDFPTTRSYLKLMLCNIHDELERRADMAAVMRLLAEPRADTTAAAELSAEA